LSLFVFVLEEKSAPLIHPPNELEIDDSIAALLTSPLKEYVMITVEVLVPMCR